ncbi:MepB family protein [Zhouia amylolytica]|uniref:MepB family protein n=1 Tax=Zhouia amylolytica TaxID=376730 RepID=UPI0020CC075F|nr:MepB family protein [Zhouia amylolytica]MCQ0111164.1 MepB family protein [Zhouia amylolytica]
MPPELVIIINEVYTPSELYISEFITETESKEYNACQFKLNHHRILYRKAKTTPKKVGQFVTCWKRNNEGITEPLHESDAIDFYMITTQNGNQSGQFIFPKIILLQKGIIGTDQKEGKRGFRVYPPWDTTSSKQAIKTQQWQLQYFFNMDQDSNSHKIQNLLAIPH